MAKVDVYEIQLENEDDSFTVVSKSGRWSVTVYGDNTIDIQDEKARDLTSYLAEYVVNEAKIKDLVKVWKASQASDVETAVNSLVLTLHQEDHPESRTATAFEVAE